MSTVPEGRSLRNAQQADTPDDHQVRVLARIDGAAQGLVELLVANATVRAVHHFVRVAVRAGVVANAAWAGPGRAESGHGRADRLRLRLLDCGGRGHSQQ